jgi:hypothetical protein
VVKPIPLGEPKVGAPPGLGVVTATIAVESELGLLSLLELVMSHPAASTATANPRARFLSLFMVFIVVPISRRRNSPAFHGQYPIVSAVILEQANFVKSIVRCRHFQGGGALVEGDFEKDAPGNR